ncbi:hypothetical protein ACFE04_006010 [Oxalis oulophora]
MLFLVDVCFFVVVATTRRQLLASDSGAFADWAATSASASAIRAGADDLSLGFNAGPSANPPPSTGWPPPSSAVTATGRQYGISPAEMGMVNLRDVFVVAPAASFNHHHHHHHHGGGNDHMTSSDHMGVGVIPLLSAAPCIAAAPQNDDTDMFGNSRNKVNPIQFWQQSQTNPHNHHHQTHHQQFIKSSTKNNTMLDQNNNLFNAAAAGGSGSRPIGGDHGGSGSASSSGTTTCQDCGNQAKKDCPHKRCRTCCKSRGLDCTTHVKSTWVPAARRRERQLMAAAVVEGAAGSSGSTSGAKKPRLITSQTTSHTSTSNTTPPRSFDTSSSHQDLGFKESLPGQVRAPAVFKCVRVTSVEDGGEDEFAYQAMVKIGGHVFKGFLYDHGMDPSQEGFPNLSELHLGGGGGGGRNGQSSSAPMIDPSDVYGGNSGGALLGGSSYGNIQ